MAVMILGEEGSEQSCTGEKLGGNSENPGREKAAKSGAGGRAGPEDKGLVSPSKEPSWGRGTGIQREALSQMDFCEV